MNAESACKRKILTYFRSSCRTPQNTFTKKRSHTRTDKERTIKCTIFFKICQINAEYESANEEVLRLSINYLKIKCLDERRS